MHSFIPHNIMCYAHSFPCFVSLQLGIQNWIWILYCYSFSFENCWYKPVGILILLLSPVRKREIIFLRSQMSLLGQRYCTFWLWEDYHQTTKEFGLNLCKGWKNYFECFFLKNGICKEKNMYPGGECWNCQYNVLHSEHSKLCSASAVLAENRRLQMSCSSLTSSVFYDHFRIFLNHQWQTKTWLTIRLPHLAWSDEVPLYLQSAFPLQQSHDFTAGTLRAATLSVSALYHLSLIRKGKKAVKWAADSASALRTRSVVLLLLFSPPFWAPTLRIEKVSTQRQAHQHFTYLE